LFKDWANERACKGIGDFTCSPNKVAQHENLLLEGFVKVLQELIKDTILSRRFVGR
jgi:hypothetical protein